MIARLQKTKLVEEILLKTLQSGVYPETSSVLEEVQAQLGNRAFGKPLTRLRPAVPGRPIGNTLGTDLYLTQLELREDLETLYTGLINLSARAVDAYSIFSVRRDRLSLKMAQLKVQAGTMLAQVSAGSRASVSDSFNTLEHVDLDRTNAYLELNEGVATLKPDNAQSVAYDGRRIRVTQLNRPLGAVELGMPFSAVFTAYRTDAWYVQVPSLESEYDVVVSVTGADYEQGDTEEVEVNALRVQPTGPLKLRLQWSPDGFNWHELEPGVDTLVTDQRTFHFQTIRAGYLRLRLKPSGGVSNNAYVLGLKKIELFQRGYNTQTTLYSQEWTFSQPVHTVVAELEKETPSGTRIDSYLAQNPDGPWIKIGNGPVAFGTVRAPQITLKDFNPESDLKRFYYSTVPDQYVLPESGELWGGRNQVHLSAFPWNWNASMDRDHLPMREDWQQPRGVVRQGIFGNRGELSSADAVEDGWVEDRNPLAFQEYNGESYSVLAVTQSDGEFSLQPGYNYRVRSYLYCSTPLTLEGQKIGVVNPADTGGISSAVVAPHSLYLNGVKVYERKDCVLSLDNLTESYQATLPLQQGWNELELLVQIPADLPTLRETEDSGVSSGGIYLYFQPDVFNHIDSIITESRAYREPWKKVSEFDLRYNVAPGRREVWSWWRDATTDAVSGVLFNHNPANPTSGSVDFDEDAPFYTVDGLNAGRVVELELRYTVERTDLDTDIYPRSLWFRADLSKDPDATSPPLLHGYRLIVN
jgi:hypothetical protein